MLIYRQVLGGKEEVEGCLMLFRYSATLLDHSSKPSFSEKTGMYGVNFGDSDLFVNPRSENSRLTAPLDVLKPLER